MSRWYCYCYYCYYWELGSISEKYTKRKRVQLEMSLNWWTNLEAKFYLFVFRLFVRIRAEAKRIRFCWVKLDLEALSVDFFFHRNSMILCAVCGNVCDLAWKPRNFEENSYFFMKIRENSIKTRDFHYKFEKFNENFCISIENSKFSM